MVDIGTGDVFRDLGFADAGERKARIQLAMRLNDLIDERKLTQIAAAEIFGIPRRHVSELRNYKLKRFSSERLLHFILLLDQDSSGEALGLKLLQSVREMKGAQAVRSTKIEPNDVVQARQSTGLSQAQTAKMQRSEALVKPDVSASRRNAETRIKYTDDPLGQVQVVPDSLPSPTELAFREEGVKVALALSRK